MLRIIYLKSYRSFITSYRKAGIHGNFRSDTCCETISYITARGLREKLFFDVIREAEQTQSDLQSKYS